MNLFKLTAIVIATFISAQVMGQDQILTLEQTPVQIKSYVQSNFPANKILRVKKDKELTKIDYEVKLDNNIELVFDKNLSLQEIESKTLLPKKVIPPMIWNYVSENFPNNHIIGWKKERNRQKVELDNDLDLYFDLNGKFLKSED